MAFLKIEKLGVVDFISPQDDAIDLTLDEATGLPRSDLEKYKETWDFETHCVLKAGHEATKFKLNFALSNKRQMMIDNASLGGDGKKEEFGFKLGKHKYWVVKALLVGIQNPTDMPTHSALLFKADNQGFASDEIIDDLRKFGIMEEIYSFYLTNKDNTELLKKK